MRIEEIKLKNFRQYVNAKIEFPNMYDNDIHIVLGRNGAGKTTILNAINWCLYGEEPHIFSKNKSLPLINTNKVENGDDKEIKVEIKVNVNDFESYVYSRRKIYDSPENKSLTP